MIERIKINKNKVIEIFNLLDRLDKSENSIEMKYFIKKNKKNLDNENEILKLLFESNSNRFKEYEEKRIKKIQECAKKENGKISLAKDGKSVEIEEDKLNEFNFYIKKLNIEYEDALKEREKELNNLNKFLSQEIEIDILKISNEDIPNNLSQDDYEIIYPLIY
jgi:hypothetical protein